MSKPDQQQHDWEPCPAGMLSRTVRGIQTRRRDRFRVKAASTVGGVLVLVIAAAIVAQQFDRSPVKAPAMGRLTCAAAQRLLPAYFADKLEAAVREQVDTHLERCPHCRDMFERGKNDTARDVERLDDPTLLALRT